ncbi:MAG: flagellar hook-associated protein FlgK [Micavibrio aeruginosavorus]|uniref:Flagellar hook-associated protein 1 n=1 Tax=Micavibrio aeruginosavorus TaxID=349221 RepID=A0A7T5R2N5_9BACT|nr:MAG: flagellar hook-associated protein FlgK [Micavibrio aeruginosavorus]
MSFSGLNSALSGLRVAQQQLSVISNNVANVGTEGYTRKILPQSTVTMQGTTIGVKGDPIIRNVDLNLERDYWTQISSTTFYDVKLDYLSRIQQFHGAPEKELSVSAQISKLRDSFAALADSPEDTFKQRAVIQQAQTVATKFNDFSALLDEMRNDTQEDIVLAVEEINTLLQTIAATNKEIKLDKTFNKTTAATEDLRDQSIKKLSELMDISFFTRGDGVLVVQTRQGVQLADERAETVFFEIGSPLGPDSYYPDSANGIYVGGDPSENINAINITETGLGGKVGSLIELRDDVLPRQQAQLDELAHKMAMRFESQGLRLFTDSTGSVPANTAPVPAVPGPLAPVAYVGFSREIQVNQNIINDNSLIQTGTAATDLPVQSGSNETLRRIVEFTFGEIEYQEAVGNVDVRANGTGGVTLQEWLGLYSQNTLQGTLDVSSYSDLQAFIDAGGTVFDPNPPGPPINDTFEITFDDPRLGVPSQTYSLSLSAIHLAYPIGGAITNAADQLAAAINNLAPPTDPAFAVQASVSPYGELTIQSRANITLDASSMANGMREEGLALLGFTEGTFDTTDPYIDVQVGKDNPVRVTIEPGDTETELADKLEYDSSTGTGVPGLYVDIDAATGFLTLRPGNDDSNGGPVFGGDIKIIGGPFTADGTGGSGVAAGATVIESLFGNNNPINNILHTTNSTFRYSNLGPYADINTGIISSTTLIDYSQKMVNQHAEEVLLAEARMNDEQSFRDLIQKEFLDQSSVNIDEELSHLIVVQTAYAASARMISAIDELFAELLNAFR